MSHTKGKDYLFLIVKLVDPPVGNIYIILKRIEKTLYILLYFPAADAAPLINSYFFCCKNVGSTSRPDLSV